MQNHCEHEPVDFGGPLVGIDPGSTITTIVLLSGSEDRPWLVKRLGVRYGATSCTRFAGYAAMVSGVMRVLNQAPVPQMVAIEGYTGKSGLRTTAEAIEIGALLREKILAHRWRLIEAPTSAIRAFVTGNCKANVGDMMHALDTLYPNSVSGGRLGPYATAYALAQMARCAVHPSAYGEQQYQVIFETEMLATF